MSQGSQFIELYSKIPFLRNKWKLTISLLSIIFWQSYSPRVLELNIQGLQISNFLQDHAGPKGLELEYW